MLRLAVLVLLSTGCATTRFYEREALADPAMTPDHDAQMAWIRAKMHAAREGGLGSFGEGAAGSCGCQ